MVPTIVTILRELIRQEIHDMNVSESEYNGLFEQIVRKLNERKDGPNIGAKG